MSGPPNGGAADSPVPTIIPLHHLTDHCQSSQGHGNVSFLVVKVNAYVDRNDGLLSMYKEWESIFDDCWDHRSIKQLQKRKFKLAVISWWSLGRENLETHAYFVLDFSRHPVSIDNLGRQVDKSDLDQTWPGPIGFFYAEEQKRDAQYYLESILPQLGFESDSKNRQLDLQGEKTLKLAISTLEILKNNL